MSRDSGSWRNSWRRTHETPAAASPKTPPNPHGVISPFDQLSAARAVVPPPLLCGVRAIVGSPSSCLPWRVHVVCAMNSLHPARTPPNPVSGWPTWWGLASSYPLDREYRKPGHQMSFPSCLPGVPLPPGTQFPVGGDIRSYLEIFYLSHLEVEGDASGTSGQSSGMLLNIFQ